MSIKRSASSVCGARAPKRVASQGVAVMVEAERALERDDVGEPADVAAILSAQPSARF
jgi:hypothetical protein